MRARGIDELEAQFEEALIAGRETARLAPPRRRQRDRVDDYATPPRQIDLAVRNVRVLARGAIRALTLDENVPPELGEALRDLAAASRALEAALEDESQIEAVRETALRAAGRATLVLERTGNLSVSVLVGQVRSTAVDLLRGTGLSYDEASRPCGARPRRPRRRTPAQSGLAGRAPPRRAAADGRAPRGVRQRGQARPPAVRDRSPRCARRRCGSRRAPPRARPAAGRRAPRSTASPAGRWGARRARQRISSARRLPTPEIAPWSSSRALIGAVPRPMRARNVARSTSAASGPTWLKSGFSTARPSLRRSRSAKRPPSSNSTVKRSQSGFSCGASRAIDPAIPRCRPRVGPSSVSSHRNLPRRCALANRWPTSAEAISPGWCGRQT